MNDRKEIDPSNRGSIVIGSVAFYLDRYGLRGPAARAADAPGGSAAGARDHSPRLITAANVFVEYPPYDMN